ncbi:MAG TPA: hypothetical protein DDZ65_03465 [Firmicutes bacterium]|nr:hypothetical protein [Bacillota bacterium]
MAAGTIESVFSLCRILRTSRIIAITNAAISQITLSAEKIAPAINKHIVFCGNGKRQPYCRYI